MSSYRAIFHFILKYKYAVIFPVAVAEGPIITIIAGILVSLGDLKFLPTLLIVWAGDLVSDPLLYSIGRFGRRVLQRFKFATIQETRLEQIRKHLEEYPWRTMIVSKVSYGIGSLFLVAAGAVRMPIVKFMKYIATLDIVKSLILLTVGYYFGRVVLHFSRYLPYYAIVVIVIVPFGYWLWARRKGRGGNDGRSDSAASGETRLERLMLDKDAPTDHHI